MNSITIPIIALSLLCTGCLVRSHDRFVSGRRTTEPTTVGGALAEYNCYRALGPITLDGKLDEPSWLLADETGCFVLYSGEADEQKSTNARMVWDDRFLYVAFECKDTDIYATFTERDDPLYSQDVVELFVENKASTEGHYFEYEFSPTGVLFDLYLTAPFKGEKFTSRHLAACARMEGTLNDPSDTDAGYTVEVAIPFEDIYQKAGARPGNGEPMRLNLYRIDYSTPKELGKPGENARFLTWSPTTKINFHMPQRFGTVTFIEKPVGTAEAPAR